MKKLLTSGSRAATIAVAFLSILVASLWEVAPYVRTLHPLFDLYSTSYEAPNIRAPTATSWRLTLVTRLIVSSPLGDFLARKLLVRNGVPALVDFADHIQSDASGGENGIEYSVGGEPLIRLSDEQRDWHVRAASEESAASSKRLSEYSRSKLGLRYNSIYDYHNAYTKQSTTPSTVLSTLLNFIEKTNDVLRCIEYVDRSGAEEAAKESTKRWKDGKSLGLWDGIPVLIKPEIVIKNVPFTVGMQNPVKVSTSDDIIVQRLRASGAIIVGTTVMHEKGVQPTGYNPWMKGPNNPYDLKRFPGGSSSGSAVAVATGMVPMSIGFDGGGSIRIPASWSGVVGLAGGFGRIPFDSGLKANTFHVIKAGFLTATVNDSLEALLLLGKGVTKSEGSDHHVYHVSYGGSGPPPPHSKPRWLSSDYGSDSRPIRVGIFNDWASHRPPIDVAGTTGKDDAVVKTFEEVVEGLKDHTDNGRNIELVPFTIPHMQWQALAHGILITSMMTFANVKELYRGSSFRESPEPDDDLQPATEIQIKLGSQISAVELLSCYRIRNFALAQWRNILTEKADVILTPTTAMTALERPRGSDENGLTATALFVAVMKHIWPGNLIGLPGMSVPVGVDSDGLPVGLQVLCLHWHEADCLAVGELIEEMRRKERPAPPGNGLFIDLLQ